MIIKQHSEKNLQKSLLNILTCLINIFKSLLNNTELMKVIKSVSLKKEVADKIESMATSENRSFNNFVETKLQELVSSRDPITFEPTKTKQPA